MAINRQTLEHLRRRVLYCTLLYFTLWYCTVLCCTVLYLPHSSRRRARGYASSATARCRGVCSASATNGRDHFSTPTRATGSTAAPA
eukprot:3613308-Pyramimonas_sp.AAC.1